MMCVHPYGENDRIDELITQNNLEEIRRMVEESDVEVSDLNFSFAIRKNRAEIVE